MAHTSHVIIRSIVQSLLSHTPQQWVVVKANGHGTELEPYSQNHMQRSNPKVPQPRVGERKVTKQLAGLVDGGFEEGQYEAALASLDQIRSPEYSPLPSVSHLPYPPPCFFFHIFVRKALTSRVLGFGGDRALFFVFIIISLYVGPTSARPHA